MKLTVIIPAYNEQDRLQPSLEQYAAFYEARREADAEILVVVNGSTDRTEEVARAFAARHQHHERQQGKQGAGVERRRGAERVP